MATTGSWIYDSASGRLVPKGEYLRLKSERKVEKRSDFAFPAVIGAMAPIKSMADGKIYDDKRSYYKSIAREGCEVIGFDKNWTDHIASSFDEKSYEADVVGDVKRAIEEISSR